MKSELREKVLEIFHQHRQDSDLPFEEEYFLDFLLAKKIRQGSIRNSFKGLAKYNRFMESLQLEYGICLKLADKQKNYSVNELVDKVEECVANPKSSQAAIRYLLRRPFPWKQFLFLNAFLIVAAAFSFRLPFLFMLILMLLMLVNGTLIHVHLRDKRFAKNLAEKVLEE